jgi:hypothetical protein
MRNGRLCAAAVVAVLPAAGCADDGTVIENWPQGALGS